jgi:excisionase family DNA binding protein
METITAKQVAQQMAIYSTKKVLTAEEAATYMGVSKSYLYKLTMTRKIPFSKPLGKMCYFEREALEMFLMRNRITTTDQIEEAAERYTKQRKGGKL